MSIEINDDERRQLVLFLHQTPEFQEMDDRRQKRREKILNAGKDRLQKITGTLYKDGPAPDDETTAPNTVEVSAKETKKPAVTSESTSRNTSKPTSPVELQPESPKRFLPGAQQDDGVADDENEAAKPAVLKKPRLILGIFSIETIMMVLAAFIAFVWMYLSLTLDIAIPDEAMENQRIELKEKYGDLADFFIYIEGLQMAGRMVLSDGRVAGVVADVMASFVRGNPAEEVGIFTAVVSCTLTFPLHLLITMFSPYLEPLFLLNRPLLHAAMIHR